MGNLKFFNCRSVSLAHFNCWLVCTFIFYILLGHSEYFKNGCQDEDGSRGFRLALKLDLSHSDNKI